MEPKFDKMEARAIRRFLKEYISVTETDVDEPYRQKALSIAQDMTWFLKYTEAE